VKDIAYGEKVPNMNELRDRIVRAAESVNNEMTVPGEKLNLLFDVCRATIGAHIEIHRAHKKLCEVH
jgi:hypothetical protein